MGTLVNINEGKNQSNQENNCQTITIHTIVGSVKPSKRSSPLARKAILVRGVAVDVLLRRLWEWRGLVQREGRAPRPTKRACDSANVKAYKCI